MPHRLFMQLILLLSVIYLSGCGGGGGSSSASEPTTSQFKTTLNGIYLRWKDAQALAGATPAISRAPVIADLQSIKREVDALSVPTCLNNSKKALTDGMLVIIDSYLGYFSAFSGGNSLLLAYEATIASACSNNPTNGALTVSAPFQNLSGLSAQQATFYSVPAIHIYFTGYNQRWVGNNANAYLSYASNPIDGDWIEFSINYVGAASDDALWAGNGVSLACGTVYRTPTCSSIGIVVNRATGTISFANTVATEMNAGTTATGRTGTINGSLSFTPF